jgi:hypothetical protein
LSLFGIPETCGEVTRMPSAASQVTQWLTTDQLARLAQAGRHLHVSASRGAEALAEVAHASAGSGAHLTIYGAEVLTTADLAWIALAGNEGVAFR